MLPLELSLELAKLTKLSSGWIRTGQPISLVELPYRNRWHIHFCDGEEKSDSSTSGARS
jgi:hypothetical protein